MADQHIGDTVVIILVLGALAIGLLSMFIGWLVRVWDRFQARRGLPRVVKLSHPTAPPASLPEPPPVMSKQDQQKAGITPPIPVPVSVSGTDTAGFDLATVPSDLTYEEVVTILAGQISPSGKPVYSGKKIYSLVGGNYNDFTVLMRQLRSKDEAPAESPVDSTPIANRPTSAKFIAGVD